MNEAMLRTSTSENRGRYDWIDQLRGVAILAVIAVHVGQKIYGFRGPLQDLAAFGSSGVQLFFVVSAMTLSLSMSRRQIGYSKFILRRFFRIAPLYYFGIFLYWGFAWVGFRDLSAYTAWNILANITFLNGAVAAANNNIVPGGWAIATEVSFYMLFPLLFSFLKSLTQVVVLTLLFTGLFGIGFLLGWFDAVIQVFGIALVQKSLLMQLPCFLCGLGAFYLIKGRTSPSVAMQVISVLVFLVCAGAAATLWKTMEPVLIFLRIFFLGISFASLCVCLRSGLIERVPGSKFLADIGRRSYSIYLLHFVFAWGMVSLLENHFGMFANTNIKFTLYYALTFGFSYACAGIIMRFIEDPGVKLGELIATYRNPQAKVNG